MGQRICTREKIAIIAADEGWKEHRDKPPAFPFSPQKFTRGDLEVGVGYNVKGHLEWIALFRHTPAGVEPLARYGLFEKEEPGTGGGEIKLRMPNKLKIVRKWLEEGDGWPFQTTT